MLTNTPISHLRAFWLQEKQNNFTSYFNPLIMKSRKKNLARLFVNLVQICRLLSNVTKNKAYSDLGSYLKLGGEVHSNVEGHNLPPLVGKDRLS